MASMSSVSRSLLAFGKWSKLELLSCARAKRSATTRSEMRRCSTSLVAWPFLWRC